MPNNQNRSNQDFSRFDTMTNEELEEILRLDTQNTEGEESDLEMLLYVMEVLAVRRKNSENPGKTAGEAFKSFEENYFPADRCDDDAAAIKSKQTQNPREYKRLIMWLRHVSAVAAILIIVLFSAITTQAMGIDILQIIANWTQETFQLQSIASEETNEALADDERKFSSLQDALYFKKITTQLAPTQIPAGYELDEIIINETPVQTTFLAIYQQEEVLLKIQIKQYLKADPEQIEQNDSLIEEFESNGITYYIFADNKQLRAAWVKDNYECYISGQLDIDTIKMMIDSIE